MSKKPKILTLKNILNTGNHFRWYILIIVTIFFTLFLYPNLVIKKHQYNLGDVVENDIKATKDFFIEDTDTTETRKRQAVESILTVYDYDSKLANRISRQMQTAFDGIRKIIESGPAENSDTPISPAESLEADKNKKIASHDLIWQNKSEFEKRFGISVSNGAYNILEKENFSRNIENLIVRLLREILENGVVSNKELLLKETDKGIILRDIGTKAENVHRNLRHFYSLDQAKAMVRIIGQPVLKNLNYTLLNMIVDFTQRLIEPNISLNRNETQERKKNAAMAIKPILYKIKAGEMILREGERVTKFQLLKLQASKTGNKNEKILAGSFGSSIIILCILIIVYVLHTQNIDRAILKNNKNLLFIASVFVVFLFFVRISASLAGSMSHSLPYYISGTSIYYGIPLAAGAMTICLFSGIDIAISFAMVISAGAAFILQNRLDIFIYFMLNSSMAAYWIQDCRERKVFVKAGVKLGLLNILLVTGINLYVGMFSGFQLLWSWAFSFMGGLVTGIVTAGIAPLVEITFNYTTDIKLLELANFDQPLLRRLMIEAPGTYHHSVIIGTMVEAAASEIGANPLLAKVCGYYHDIGKIKKPLYFIENQINGVNKHDKLAPSMSSLILTAHVKNGVEIAKKHKLGQAIIDTIQQSHGTSLIQFFYEKAKKLHGNEKVNIADFRYPGPKPQTREAGLVMLADVVEAASRTLTNPTPSRIQGLVQNLINKIFSDGQLDNCELTLKDLHSIAKSFNKRLNGIHHHRIEYPEQSSGNGKAKNGSPDQQPAKKAQNINQENSESNKGHLKRLGL